MEISKHIHYRDNLEKCYRFEFNFNPPRKAPSTLGKVEVFYDDSPPDKFTHCDDIINNNHILQLREIMEPGEVLSIEVRKGYILRNISFSEEHQLQIYVNQGNSFLYWITVGKRGVLELTANLVKDEHNLCGRLARNLSDVGVRNTILKILLTNTVVELEDLGKVPELMKHSEAAKYLRISESSLYKKVALKEIKRTRNKKYRKDDLDEYINLRSKR